MPTPPHVTAVCGSLRDGSHTRTALGHALDAASDRGASTALLDLRSVCRALNAWVLPHQAAIPTASSQFADGAFVDERVADRVGTLGERVVEYARIEPDPACFESEQNVGATD